MKQVLFGAMLLMMGCAGQADDITVRFNGSTAEVSGMASLLSRDSVSVTVDGAKVNVESLYRGHRLTLRLTGESDDGQLVLNAAGKAKVTLDGLTLTSQEGAPLWLKNKKKVEVTAAKGTENTLTVTACTDTANHKAAVIWAKDKLLLSGKGTLNVVATGDGCRGIKTKKDIIVEDVTLNVMTSGNNLGEKPFGFGGPPFGGEMPDFGEGFPGFGEGFPDFGEGFPDFGGGAPPFGNDSLRPGGFPPFGGEMPDFGEDFPDFGGGFPPFGNDSTQFGGFPPFDGGMPDFGGGGFGGKRKYVASAKGIASKGKITINSGCVTVRTSTAGAEGIEGKQGIVFNGGTVDVVTPDDAINANATIEFNGAHVTAWSMGNDAVDANPEGGFFPPFGGNGRTIEPAIVIRGGTVYAWSQVGPPEEGLDSDMAPLAIEGGTIFTVGGGMGEMPSVPTNETARQPTVVLIGLSVEKDEPITIYKSTGQRVNESTGQQVTIPFSMRRSASVVSSPVFKVGGTYTVKTKDYERTFTLDEPLTVVR